MNRRFERKRRRQPLASWGFLRPHPRRVEDERVQRERLRKNPKMLREYKQSLMASMFIIGALVVSCIILVFESYRLLRKFDTSAQWPGASWALPLLAALLGWAAFRRFHKVLREYRELGHDTESSGANDDN